MAKWHVLPQPVKQNPHAIWHPNTRASKQDACQVAAHTARRYQTEYTHSQPYTHQARLTIAGYNCLLVWTTGTNKQVPGALVCCGGSRSVHPHTLARSYCTMTSYQPRDKCKYTDMAMHTSCSSTVARGSCSARIHAGTNKRWGRSVVFIQPNAQRDATCTQQCLHGNQMQHHRVLIQQTHIHAYTRTRPPPLHQPNPQSHTSKGSPGSCPQHSVATDRTVLRTCSDFSAAFLRRSSSRRRLRMSSRK